MIAPDDIRNSHSDAWWSTFGNSWTQLLTYRYMGRTNPVLDNGAHTVTMPLRHNTRNTMGGIMAAPLCIAAAESGGMHDDTHIPNPLTAVLQILDDARGVRRVRVIPETLHLGRNMGFSRSTIVDDDAPHRIIALSTGSAISLGEPPSGYRKVDNPPLEIVDASDMAPLHEVFGIRRIGPGVWEIPRLDQHTASPDAALHLGPQHIAMEAAAVDIVGAGRQIRSCHVMFVARGKCGPFHTHCSVLQGNSTCGVRVDITDVGNGSRLVSSSSAVFDR